MRQSELLIPREPTAKAGCAAGAAVKQDHAASDAPASPRLVQVGNQINQCNDLRRRRKRPKPRKMHQTREGQPCWNTECNAAVTTAPAQPQTPQLGERHVCWGATTTSNATTGANDIAKPTLERHQTKARGLPVGMPRAIAAAKKAPAALPAAAKCRSAPTT